MTRCGLAERVKGWPPGCGFAGFARLPQVFSWLGMREDAWGRRAARGRLAFWCVVAERVKGWPPGCGVRGLCPLAAGVFPGGDVGGCGGPPCARGRLAFWCVAAECVIGLPVAASAGFARLPQVFSWRGMGRMRGAAVPLEGDALSLWGIRPISEKEQSLSGKRAFGPFPIQTSLLF